MNQIQEEFQDLITLTKKLLSEEHTSQDWIFTDKQTYQSMKEYALQAGKPKPKPKTPSTPQYSPPRRKTSVQIQRKAPPAKPTNLHEPQAIEKPREQVTHEIERQPIKDLKKENFQDLRKIMQEKHPEVTVVDKILDDQKAQELSQKWKARDPESNVILLSFDQDPNHLQFLRRLAQAIEDHHLPSKVIQIDHWDETLLKKSRLVIGVEKGISEDPRLKELFQESGQDGKHLLGSAPLILLQTIGQYLQDPKLKAPLWKAICEILQDG